MRQEKGKGFRIRHRAAILFVAGVFALSGCSGTGTGAGQGNDRDPGQGNVPVEMKFFIENKLEIDTFPADKQGNPRPSGYPEFYELANMTEEEQAKWAEDAYFNGTMVQITGLKDKKVEDEINRAIKELFVSCATELPPYRGIKAMVGESPKEMKESYSVTAYAGFNVSHILSVVVNANKMYENKINPESSVFVERQEGLTFDLNTGELLSLEDLFQENVDGLEEVSRFLAEKLEKGNAQDEEKSWSVGIPFTAVKPFTGILPQQKFSVNEAGINLIFDYDTPEFETGCSAFTVLMPFSETMALATTCFQEEKNLFVSEEPIVKKLIYWTTEDTQRFDYSEDNALAYAIGNWPEDAREEQKQEWRQLCIESTDQLSAQMKPYYEQAKAEFSEEATAHYGEVMLNVHQVGQYLNVFYSKMGTVYGNIGEKSKDYFNLQEQDGKTYRKGEVEPLQLEDVFVSGVDYKKILKEAMVSAAKTGCAEQHKLNPQEEYLFAEGENREKDLSYVELLSENVKGFTVEADYLNILFSISQEEASRMVYGDGTEAPSSAYFYMQQIKYKDMGCDNLVIFD